MNNDTLDDKVNAILAQSCPYRVPPLQYLNGHAVCPCICRAVRMAYIEGYDASSKNVDPQVGVRNEKETQKD